MRSESLVCGFVAEYHRDLWVSVAVESSIYSIIIQVDLMRWVKLYLIEMCNMRSHIYIHGLVKFSWNSSSVLRCNVITAAETQNPSGAAQWFIVRKQAHAKCERHVEVLVDGLTVSSQRAKREKVSRWWKGLKDIWWTGQKRSATEGQRGRMQQT